jgi:hypothetical protein
MDETVLYLLKVSLYSIPTGLLFPGTCNAQMCKTTNPKIKKGIK